MTFLVSFILVSSIKELVEVDKNGLLFSTSSELADQLLVSYSTLLNDFVKHGTSKRRLSLPYVYVCVYVCILEHGNIINLQL